MRTAIDSAKLDIPKSAQAARQAPEGCYINPILDEDSPERVALTAQGIEVAYDGMEIDL